MKIPEKKEASPILIKHRGFFDNKKIQQTIFDWFEHNDFDPFEVDKYKLTKYPSGIKLKIRYTGSKRVTEYIKWNIQAYFIIYDIEDVEIIKKGKKIKINKGFLTVQVSGSLEMDWQKRFKGNKLLQFLGDFLRNYILRYKIVDYWEDELCIKMEQLANVIKETLGSEAIWLKDK